MRSSRAQACAGPKRGSSRRRSGRKPPACSTSRTRKVSNEQIIALLTALRLFTSGAYDRELPAMRARLERIAAALQGLPACCRTLIPADGQSLPLLEIALDEAVLGRSAFEVCRRLRRGRPPVQVGHGRVPEGK